MSMEIIFEIRNEKIVMDRLLSMNHSKYNAKNWDLWIKLSKYFIHNQRLN